VIINLSKGRIGEINAQLLGSMLVTKIYLAAMSRADVPEAELKHLPNFYLFVDEFQSFANESFADILSEARKYKLNLTITHQYIDQMPEEVRSAVFGNVGTFISFRVGAADAEYIEKEFAPVFTAEDIVNLGFAQIYLRLMIDGIGSQPFSAKTLPPISKTGESYVNEIIESSRKIYARPRAEVEAKVRELLESGREEVKKQDKKPDFKNNQKPQNNQNNFNNQNKKFDNKPKKPIFDERSKIEFERSIKRQIMDIPLDELPVESDIPLESEALSLKQLEKKRNVAQDPKKVSSENRNSLKEALAGVLGSLPQKEEVKEEKPVENKPEKQDSNEISAEDLKKILE
jgi:hypothetical protein